MHIGKKFFPATFGVIVYVGDACQIDFFAIQKKSLDRAIFFIHFYTKGSIEWYHFCIIFHRACISFLHINKFYQLYKISFKSGSFLKIVKKLITLPAFFYSNINIYNISLHLTIHILITIQRYRYDTMRSER